MPLREPLESRVVLDDAPHVEPLVYAGQTERWCVLLCNRRVARLFTGPGDELEETDRIVDDVHRRHEKGGWSQANYQRSVEKEVEDDIAHTAGVAFALFKRRGFDRLLVTPPTSSSATSRPSCTRTSGSAWSAASRRRRARPGARAGTGAAWP